MRLARYVVLSALLCPSWAVFPARELAVAEGKFTVDGTARYLVFISYFDALRATPASLESDFQYLRENGFDGVRIFPNWWDLRARKEFPSDTLMDGEGNLRPDRLAVLRSVLDCAARHGFLVDVSFAYEPVEGLSELRSDQIGVPQGALPVNHVKLEAYKRGLSQVARELRVYRNILIDVQNEFNGRITHLSDDEVRELIAAIKEVDPGRLVTASLANEIAPEEVAARTNAVGADVVAWHESRNPWRFDAMDQLVERVRMATKKPVYLGEPAVMEDGLTALEFIAAVTNAKKGGAAAWTFHTRAGFDLSSRSIRDALTEQEREFVRRFRKPLHATAWGSPSVGKTKN